MGEEAVRKYTEQAKFNQIRDSSLSNPLGQVLVPGFEVFPPVFGEMNSHILGSPVQALPTQCWREEKFLLRPHRFLPCILMSYNPWSYVQFDPTRLGEINNFFFFFYGHTEDPCRLQLRSEWGEEEGKSDDIFMKAIRVGVHKKSRNMMSILWPQRAKLPSVTWH